MGTHKYMTCTEMFVRDTLPRNINTTDLYYTTGHLYIVVWIIHSVNNNTKILIILTLCNFRGNAMTTSIIMNGVPVMMIMCSCHFSHFNLFDDAIIPFHKSIVYIRAHALTISIRRSEVHAYCLYTQKPTPGKHSGACLETEKQEGRKNVCYF